MWLWRLPSPLLQGSWGRDDHADSIADPADHPVVVDGRVCRFDASAHTVVVDQRPAGALRLRERVGRDVALMPLLRRKRQAPTQGLRVLTASSLRLNLEDRVEAKRLRALRQGWQCADTETEILTTRGWLSHDELAVGDIALTLNHETGESEWQAVEAINAYEVADTAMVSMEGRLHSSLTTTGHKWPVLDTRTAWTPADAVRRRERRHGLEPRTAVAERPSATTTRRMVRSDALTSKQSLVTAAPCAELPQENVHSDAFVELVAWFWTEGSAREHGYVSITQSFKANPDCVVRIRDALTAVFGPGLPTTRGVPVPAWRERRDGNCAVFALNRFAGRRLIAVAPRKVVHDGFIHSLTLAQLELFVQTSIDADGHRDHGTNVVLTQAKKERIEPLILAAILTGRTPHLYPRRNGQWTVHLRDKATVSPMGASKTEWANRAKVVCKSYTGTVWCPTLPNHTWLARRNGTVYYTGNSDAWNYRDSIGELRYAINFLANSASRMRLFVGVEPLSGDIDQQPVRLSEGGHDIPDQFASEASQALNDLAANEGSRRTIMKNISTNISVTGECFVMGRVDPETAKETWTIRSLDELVLTDEKYKLREIPSGPQGIIPEIELDPKLTTISRVWLPHPRFGLLADSSMRAMLSDNESLLIMRRMIRSDSRSRLGRGLLLIPDELSIKVPTDDNEDPEADPFMGALAQAMMEPISDEGVASAVVPIVVRGPAEALKELRRVDLSMPYEKAAAETREELVGIIATSFDLPKEVIMGIVDLNHWSAWNVDDNTFRHHIEPHVIDLCDALTGGYFHPRLLANGVPSEYVNRLVIWYDPTELVTHPDQTSDALKLHENLALSDAALLRIAGFSEDDAPSKQEIQVRLLEKMRQWPPNLVMAFLHAWDPTLVAPAMVGPPAVPGITPTGVDTGDELKPQVLPGRPGAPAMLPAAPNGSSPASTAEQPVIGPPPAATASAVFEEERGPDGKWLPGPHEDKNPGASGGGSLPNDQKAAVGEYVGGTTKYNESLRSGGSLGSTEQQAVSNMDQAVSSQSVSADTTAYRAVYDSPQAGSQAPDYSGMEPGTKFTDPGFTSASSNSGYIDQVAKEYGAPDQALEIHVPSGTNALNVNGTLGDAAAHPEESEMVLGRGTTYEVVSQAEGRTVVQVVK